MISDWASLFIRCRKADVEYEQRREEELVEKVARKVVAEQKVQGRFATPWKKDLGVSK